MTLKKRFIAGAICPACNALDKIVNYRDEDKSYRECVACGFKDEIHLQPVARELETRVNRTEQEKRQETQVLLFPPKD